MLDNFTLFPTIDPPTLIFIFGSAVVLRLLYFFHLRSVLKAFLYRLIQAILADSCFLRSYLFHPAFPIRLFVSLKFVVGTLLNGKVWFPEIFRHTRISQNVGVLPENVEGLRIAILEVIEFPHRFFTVMPAFTRIHQWFEVSLEVFVNFFVVFSDQFFYEFGLCEGL